MIGIKARPGEVGASQARATRNESWVGAGRCFQVGSGVVGCTSMSFGTRNGRMIGYMGAETCGWGWSNHSGRGQTWSLQKVGYIKIMNSCWKGCSRECKILFIKLGMSSGENTRGFRVQTTKTIVETVVTKKYVRTAARGQLMSYIIIQEQKHATIKGFKFA